MNTDVLTGKPISETQLPAPFASPDYNILLVTDKDQTGFDQPLLCAMYADKHLDNVQAVQTLSRLNRKIPGNKIPLILHFYNYMDNTYHTFKSYYDKTSRPEASDSSKLKKLKYELDKYQAYHWSDVEAFAHRHTIY